MAVSRQLFSMTTGDMERAERGAFSRDFSRSRHNRAPECRCSGDGPLCSFCPERDVSCLSDTKAQERT